MTVTEQVQGVEGKAQEEPERPVRHRLRHHLRHHPWRVAATVLVGLVVVGFAVTTGRYLLRSHPGAKSVSSAVERYRSSTTVTNPGSTNFAGPRPGVYQATGSGAERISFPPNSQADGAVMPVTVTAQRNGCWQWRIDYNTAHWHEYVFCPQKGRLMLVAQSNFQRWDFGSIKVTNLGRFTCVPPAPIVVQGAAPGQVFEQHCDGTNSAVKGPSVTEGPATVLGTVTMTIGGQQVRALEQTRVSHLSGSQKGTVTERWWFDAATGLPLRAERHYRVTSPSPVGHITYTEDGSWQLRSLAPAT